VYFGHSGSFRFRGDVFGGVHLYGAVRQDVLNSRFASGFLPPLATNAANTGAASDVAASDRDGSWVGSANVRFRWEPSLYIDDSLAIHTQIDILDNLVLGSTPGYGSSDPLHPNAWFSESMAPPTAGANAVWDSIRIKRAWAEWQIVHWLRMEAGRMPHHWGMGLLHHGGDCIDCDYGDSVDRAGGWIGPFEIEDLGIDNLYAGFTWDFPGEGAILDDPRDFFGQPYDASQPDDVDQFTLQLLSQPRTKAALAARAEALHVERRPVVDWGWHNAFRFENLASDFPIEFQQGGQSCQPAYDGAVYPWVGQDFDCIVLLPRDAFYWMTDFWMRLEWRPQPTDRLLIEMELAGLLFGSAGQLQGLADVDSSKDIWGGAGVIRALYETAGLGVGLEVGAASGDPDSRRFGVADASNVVLPDADYETAVGAAIAGDRSHTQFRMNRDYHVDLLLFREVLGAVTNTVYFKPSVSYDLLSSRDLTLGTRWDLLYAMAMFPEATPGGGRSFGVELDGQIYVKAADHFVGVVEGGVLLPLDALDAPSLGYDAQIPWTVQFRMHILF
jgi:uncharacterized protein (TIGR04551 family)